MLLPSRCQLTQAGVSLLCTPQDLVCILVLGLEERHVAALEFEIEFGTER